VCAAEGVSACGVAARPDQAAPPIKPAAPIPATQTRAAVGVRRVNLLMVCNPSSTICGPVDPRPLSDWTKQTLSLPFQPHYIGERIARGEVARVAFRPSSPQPAARR